MLVLMHYRHAWTLLQIARVSDRWNHSIAGRHRFCTSLSPAHANRCVCEDLCSVFTVVVVDEKKTIDVCSHIVVPRFAWLEIFTTSGISSLHSVTHIFFFFFFKTEARDLPMTHIFEVSFIFNKEIY
jgi:hypothetical protein